MDKKPAITATPEQYRQLYRILIDHEVQQIAGKMFAIPELRHFVHEICRVIPSDDLP